MIVHHHLRLGFINESNSKWFKNAYINESQSTTKKTTTKQNFHDFDIKISKAEFRNDYQNSSPISIDGYLKSMNFKQLIYACEKVFSTST
jgi:hypothetical protein